MGVYIKGMDMPISCEKCPLCYDYLNCSIDDSLQMYLYNRHPNCPLIEIDLVRCGECNHSGTDGENTFCMWLGALRKPTDFCSYGERRADEHTDKGNRYAE